MPLRAIPLIEEGILKQHQRKEERPSRVHNQFSKTIGVTGLACTSGYPRRQNTILLIRKKDSMHKWYATISRPSYLERKALGTGLWNRAQGKKTHLLSQEHPSTQEREEAHCHQQTNSIGEGSQGASIVVFLVIVLVAVMLPPLSGDEMVFL